MLFLAGSGAQGSGSLSGMRGRGEKTVRLDARSSRCNYLNVVLVTVEITEHQHDLIINKPASGLSLQGRIRFPGIYLPPSFDVGRDRPR